MTETSTPNAIPTRTSSIYLSNGMGEQELEAIFAQLAAPRVADLSGAYRGRLHAVEGVCRLPQTLRRPVHVLVNSPLSPWKGKYIDKRQGGNMLFNRQGKHQLGFYDVRRGQALDDGRPVIELDYDVPQNPPTLWPIRGELRTLGDQYYLARMLYRTAGGFFTVLYFTLEK